MPETAERLEEIRDTLGLGDCDIASLPLLNEYMCYVAPNGKGFKMTGVFSVINYNNTYIMSGYRPSYDLMQRDHLEEDNYSWLASFTGKYLRLPRPSELPNSEPSISIFGLCEAGVGPVLKNFDIKGHPELGIYATGVYFEDFGQIEWSHDVATSIIGEAEIELVDFESPKKDILVPEQSYMAPEIWTPESSYCHPLTIKDYEAAFGQYLTPEGVRQKMMEHKRLGVRFHDDPMRDFLSLHGKNPDVFEAIEHEKLRRTRSAPPEHQNDIPF